MKILKDWIQTKVKYFFLSAFTLIFILCVACAPISRISGYVPPEAEISQLVIGSSTKEEVIKKLGEPLSNKGSPKNFLIYVQKKVEVVAFFSPQIDDRKVLKLSFDDRAILSRVDFYNYDEVASKTFKADQKIVVSEGRKLTFWQQMFGNIGNFSSEQFFD